MGYVDMLLTYVSNLCDLVSSKRFFVGDKIRNRVEYSMSLLNKLIDLSRMGKLLIYVV